MNGPSRVTALLCAAALTASLGLSGCAAGGLLGSNGTASTSASAAAQSAGITLGDACWMWDQELTDALNSQGFSKGSKESDGSVTYKKGDVEISVNEKDGWRIYSNKITDDKEMFQFINNNIGQLYSIGRYTHSAGDYIVATCGVAHDNGVLIAMPGIVYIVQKDHMDALNAIVSSASIRSNDSAEIAAATLVKKFQAVGYKLVEGKGIDTSYVGSTTISTDTSSSKSSSNKNTTSSNSANSTSSKNTSSGTTGNNATSGKSTSNGTTGGNTSSKTSSKFAGKWVDPEYGDTLSLSSDGTAVTTQTGKGRISWTWTETSSGVRITNASHTYNLTYGIMNGKSVLYNNDKGLLFEKR